MASAADYRRKAEEWLRLAQMTPHSGVKSRYTIIANQWLMLAESAGKTAADPVAGEHRSDDATACEPASADAGKRDEAA